MNLSDTGPLVQARELLLDALASLDAGYEWPVVPELCVLLAPEAFTFSGEAICDAAVELGIDEADPEDMELVCEHALELLDQRLDTGQRPTARPL